MARRMKQLRSLQMGAFVSSLASCVHMLRNNEPKLFVFVNKMKAIKSELKAELPIVPTRTISDLLFKKLWVYRSSDDKVKSEESIKVRTCPRKNDVNFLYPAVVVPGGGSDHVDVGI
ncbi:hypothetical protein Tco_1067481 [Tanacetum coccineum]|uniref:Uncharacterized protein n=1 Tax=Tanacetum coccineum TaxID=301880 RepID=A0ABQ5HCZ8_9ASTR